MKQVYKNLYVGNQTDFENNKDIFRKWRVVHACKFPYHRAIVGYKGNSAPKGPQYLYVYDLNNHLALNIIDVEDPSFFADEMIDEAINYSLEGLTKGLPVLIHCNQGESRAPCIAMMVMRKLGVLDKDFTESCIYFRNLYPEFNPKNGILEYTKERWEELKNEN